ncbi:nuclear receptor-binding factor 2-like [Galleria mellonella]|uniref:Nuclear receptor-binding factor 2-like n=1 Tax=Galleria mellonella TaxID=7137 RepID=A0A6J1W8C1_GALME|nr:nuclear receptor-binding factor 2-like [Galleria mellonella]
MESHPLNLAHQQHRRAETHLVNNRYDEAMQCHHNAAELLLDAMKSTTSSVALESITLQHSYHLKQKDLIKIKKEQYARVKKAIDNIKALSKEPPKILQPNDCSMIQVAIFRTINHNDSLLQILTNKNDDEEPIVKHKVIKDDIPDGKILEKSQNTVIEELQVLSQNLRSFVEQLVLEVEVLKDENMALKERVNYLEKERTRYMNFPLPQNDFNNYQPNIPSIEDLSNDFAQKLPIPKASDKPTIIPSVFPVPSSSIERPSQQTHFDLSALKNN